MLVEEVRSHLTEKIIPFWNRMKDDLNGGYYGYMDFDLNIDKKAVKGCILNSRILWFYSNAYMLLKEKTLLENATHAYNFLKNHCFDHQYGGIFWSLNYDGTVFDSSKHTYNQAFAIYALSSYYDITNDDNAIQMARAIYQTIEKRCKDEFGYLEAFNQLFEPSSNEKLSENGVLAAKTMNTLLHVLEAYTEFYRVTKDVQVKDRLKWILDIIADKIYNPKLRRQEVFFDKHYNSILDLHSFGHDIETAWLVDRTCEIINESELTTRMQKVTNELEQEIYETAYHGHSLWNECDRGEVDTSRIWWVQAEAVVGFMNAFQKNTEKKEYSQAVNDIWNYIKENLIDKREGSEWFWRLDDNGKPSSKQPIVEPWKCPYHNGRMCFEIIRRNINAS